MYQTLVQAARASYLRLTLKQTTNRYKLGIWLSDLWEIIRCIVCSSHKDYIYIIPHDNIWYGTNTFISIHSFFVLLRTQGAEAAINACDPML